MTILTMKESVSNIVNGCFGTLLAGFFSESLSHMVPWLIASFAVIVCDLCFGVRKSLLLHVEVRFSSAIRRTMGKMLTYCWFVCLACFIEVAAGSTLGIDKWACLSVCFIEFCSIVSNILKPKGYKFNMRKLFVLVASKAVDENKEELEDIIEKDVEKKV